MTYSPAVLNKKRSGAKSLSVLRIRTKWIGFARQSLAIRSNGQLETAAAYRPLIVAWRNGAPVRLEEVALVRDDVEDNRRANWIVDKHGDQRAIILAIQRQPGANTIATVAAIKAMAWPRVVRPLMSTLGWVINALMCESRAEVQPSVGVQLQLVCRRLHGLQRPRRCPEGVFV